jgi:hypothetical protein
VRREPDINDITIGDSHMTAVLGFLRALWAMPVGWRVWLAWLGAVNLASVFFLDRLEAQLTLAAITFAFVVGVTLFRFFAFTRLLGLMHFVWFALLPYLWLQAQTEPPGTFRVWLYIILATNGACLAIDVVDVIRYAAGDRRPSVPVE